MSHEAIAAALARNDLSCGERLVAFSLASFADRENRARPGTPAAAGRAGLARSRFLEARDRLVRRGLVVVEQAASGRGRASTLVLRFAQLGPWWEAEINAELFEAVLGYSISRGPTRLLLAVIAALADEHGLVEGITTEQLCAAAGVADRTYRRARAMLLASGELILRSGSGGRGNTNCWEIPNPRTRPGATPPGRGGRVPPPAGARPLMAPVGVPVAGERHDVEPVPAEVVPDSDGHALGAVKDGQDRTLPGQNRPALTGVSAVKSGQDRTVSGETPAQTPAETPAPNARAGREPQNPRSAPRGAMRKEMTDEQHLIRTGWSAGPGPMQRPGEAGGQSRRGSARRRRERPRQRDGRAALPDARVRASETERRSESKVVVEAPRFLKRPETWRTWVVDSNDAALFDGGMLHARLSGLGAVTDGRLRVPGGRAVGVEPVADPVKRIMVNVGSAPDAPGCWWQPGKARCLLMRRGRDGGVVVLRGRESRPHREGRQQDRNMRSRSGGRA
jgi:hypothetical protein